jgi:hypothetical protein
MNDEPMSCRELVELVTEYLEQALPLGERERFDAHLALCDPCVTYLAQMKQTLAAVGTLNEEAVPPEAQQKLLEAFRDWRR